MKISIAIGTTLLLHQARAVQVQSFSASLPSMGGAAPVQSLAAGHPGGGGIYIPSKPRTVQDYLNEPVAVANDA